MLSWQFHLLRLYFRAQRFFSHPGVALSATKVVAFSATIICMGTTIALSRPGIDRHNHLAACFPPSAQVFLNGLENVS